MFGIDLINYESAPIANQIYKVKSIRNSILSKMLLKKIWDRVYLIVAVIFVVMVYYVDLETFGYKKTVGYTYNFTNVAKLLCLISLLLSFFSYLLLSILKYKNPTNITSIYVFSILITVTINIYFAIPFFMFLHLVFCQLLRFC